VAWGTEENHKNFSKGSPSSHRNLNSGPPELSRKLTVVKSGKKPHDVKVVNKEILCSVTDVEPSPSYIQYTDVSLKAVLKLWEVITKCNFSYVWGITLHPVYFISLFKYSTV
jgi:hypothetical protein